MLQDALKELASLQHEANELNFKLDVVNRKIKTLQKEQIIPVLKEQQGLTGQDAASYALENGSKITVKLKHKIRGSINYENAYQASEIMQRVMDKPFEWGITLKGGADVLDTLKKEGYNAVGKPDIPWNTLSAQIKKGIMEGTLSQEDMDVLKVTIEDELQVKES